MEILSKSVIALLSSIFGAIIILKAKLTHERFCALISFAAGALFSAAVLSILPETYQKLTFVETLLAFFSGYILFYAIGKYYFHVCPSCSASHFDENMTKKFKQIAFLMITSFSVHSFSDGLAISIEEEQYSSIFLAIFFHKFPEGIALASIMLSAGYSKIKTIFYIIAIQTTTIFGAIVGAALLDYNILNFATINLILAHIGGGFIYLSLHAILGEMLKHDMKKVFFYFFIGLIIVGSSNFFHMH